MKTLVLGSYVIKLYDSIDELPVLNFQKYNKLMLIDAGIGSDLNDIDAHITKVGKYIASKDQEKAMQELQNMRQNLYMISSGINPRHMAFAALVASVNGEPQTDLSDTGLSKLLDRIRFAKRSRLMDFLADIKKKLNFELETYFPAIFGGDPREKEAYDELKRRTLLVLSEIKDEKDNSEEISKIDDYLFSLSKPKVFQGPESVEVGYDKSFETMCILISQKAQIDAKKCTVMAFYSAVETIKKQAEAEMKANKKTLK